MRLFVAIELSEAVRKALAGVQDVMRSGCRDSVRWVQPNQLHLTVKFLGDVEEAQIPEIRRALQEAGAKSSSFDMAVQNCGCFPLRGDVRVIWAGVHEASGRLNQCVTAVEDRLGSLGFPREQRPYSAHITLGRVREDRSRGAIRDLVAKTTQETIDQPVREMLLMSSQLSKEGPNYSVMYRAALGGG